jgi:hypothetical protein
LEVLTYGKVDCLEKRDIHIAGAFARPPRDTSLRVLFFDTRDHTGGHATVHNALIRHFDQTRIRPFAIANSATYDSRAIEEAYRAIPGTGMDGAAVRRPAHQNSWPGAQNEKPGDVCALPGARHRSSATLAH